MGQTVFPLRWESTGDQWWFASPIDCAAANGHYDLVRELLHMDPNLLIKLTSLPRIRRLETVWDDDEERSTTVNAAKNRSAVARNLLQECETTKKGHNSLLRSGYGGWLMYTAAAAGDPALVKELLERDPRLVFGEGEYGVTDIFYAAARGRNREVFRMLIDGCVPPEREVPAVFRWEIAKRAVHAAARGGDVEMLRELLRDGNDVLVYRDAFGSTVLHSASGRGQVEVVKYLISSYDVIAAVDDHGSTALHVAAYRGHLPVLKALVSASPLSASLTNNQGNTFLHMAVFGSRAPSFRRLDRQIELIRNIVSGSLVDIEEIVNVRNNEGRTVLHVAVTGENIQSDIVEMIMSARYVDLSVRDAGGSTPLDLLRQRPRSPASEILIKRLVSAGGISGGQDQTADNALALNSMVQGIGTSPGTSFRIPDGEISLHLGNEDAIQPSSCDVTNSEHGYSGEIKAARSTNESKPLWKLVSKIFLRWPRMRERKSDVDNYSLDSYRMSSCRNSPISLRQQHLSSPSMPSNKRVLSLRGNLPTEKKLSGMVLPHSVRQVLPKSNLGSPCSAFSDSSPAYNRKSRNYESFSAGPSSSSQSPNLEKVKLKRKHGSFNLRSMNNYLCLSGRRLGFDESSIGHQPEHQGRSNLVA